MHAESTTAPPSESTPRWRLVHATEDAEVFVPPSREVEQAYRRFPALFTPLAGSDPLRPVRDFLVVPLAFLTPINVHHQLYLVDIFHQRSITWVGHTVGMLGVNSVLGAVAVEATGSPLAGMAWVGLLAAWYAAIARSVGLWGWWLASVPLLAGIGWASVALSASLDWTGLAVAHLVATWTVAFGHLLEQLPPRSGHPSRWLPIPTFVFGEPSNRRTPLEVLLCILRLTPGPLIGVVNETLGSPRVMFYVLLRNLMSVGYAPELRALQDDWRDRAWASGNPALDYIGVGGGTHLEFTAPPAPSRGPADG